MLKSYVKRVADEYRNGGLGHLLVSPIEAVFVTVLRQIPPLYDWIAPQYFRWRCSDDIFRYECSPDPFKIGTVSPDHIKHWTGRPNPYFNRRKVFGAVEDGDWDRSDMSFEDEIYHRSMVQRFVDGKPWEKTDLTKRRLQRAGTQNTDRLRYSTRGEVIERSKEYERQFEQIREQGYQSQTKLLDEGEYNDGVFLDELDEVAVDVGRDGELLLADGRHRLSIAKILGVDEIPVVFLVRHKEWMEYREKLCEGDEPIPDHPDLRDLK